MRCEERAEGTVAFSTSSVETQDLFHQQQSEEAGGSRVVTEVIITGPRSLNRQNAEILTSFLEQTPSVRVLKLSGLLANDGAQDVMRRFFQRQESLESVHCNLLCQIDHNVMECLLSGLSDNTSVIELGFTYVGFEGEVDGRSDSRNYESLNSLLLAKRNHLQSLVFSICSFGRNLSRLSEALSCQNALESFRFIGGKPDDAGSAVILKSLPKRTLRDLYFDNPFIGKHAYRTMVQMIRSHDRILRRVVFPLHLFYDEEMRLLFLSALKVNSSIVQFEIAPTTHPSPAARSTKNLQTLEMEMNTYSARNKNIAHIWDMVKLQSRSEASPQSQQNLFPSCALCCRALAAMAGLDPSTNASAMFLLLTQMDLQ